MNMKVVAKITMMVLSLVVCFSLASCSRLNDIMTLTTEDNQKVSAVLDEVVEAIEQEDQDKLISLFSQNVQDSTADLEEKADALIALFQNKDLSFEVLVATANERRFNHGSRMEKLYPTIDVYADGELYYASMVLCTVNSADRKEEGILTLAFINAKDWNDAEGRYRGAEKAEVEGIYGILIDR